MDFRYKQTADEAAVVVCKLRPTAIDNDVREAFIETAQQIGELFSAHARTKKRAYHQPKLGEAAFKDSALAALLVGGLGATELPPLPHVDDAAFTSGARDLLERLSAEPTDEFYKQHKDALNALVQEPTQRLLHAAIALTRQEIRDTMETEKRLFAQFRKQWGNGIWDFYWGALYPKGGKRTEDAQLYVQLDKDAFRFGFSIGAGGSEQLKRLARSCHDNSATRATAWRTLSTLPVIFGDDEGDGSSLSEPGQATLTLGSWLSSVQSAGADARVRLDWAQVLAMREDELASRIADTFNRLFPLVLLAVLDEPMPAVGRYIGDEGEPEGPNPQYSLADLASETGFEPATLERWVRAIDARSRRSYTVHQARARPTSPSG